MDDGVLDIFVGIGSDINTFLVLVVILEGDDNGCCDFVSSNEIGVIDNFVIEDVEDVFLNVGSALLSLIVVDVVVEGFGFGFASVIGLTYLYTK